MTLRAHQSHPPGRSADHELRSELLAQVLEPQQQLCDNTPCPGRRDVLAAIRRALQRLTVHRKGRSTVIQLVNRSIQNLGEFRLVVVDIVRAYQQITTRHKRHSCTRRADWEASYVNLPAGKQPH